MRFAPSKIEEIRAAADIVDIVSGFVRLKKAGARFVGLCPFHQEKTPSFNVNSQRGLFKCFGCGKGGNAITFLMEIQKISFPEAVEQIAEKYHIALPVEREEERETREDIDGLYAATHMAARFFYDVLHGDGGRPAADYIRKRGWTEETQRRFGIGYAPDSWDALLRHAREQGIGEEALEKTGLVIRKEGGGAYDRFRGRLVFPIFSIAKKVVGFGARTLSAEEQVKYLNSPETAIYSKSRVLYGLTQAAQAIRDADAAILVEGYADVLSMSQAGLTNVVASSGTALTSDQVRLLARYTRNIYFLYDADAAGVSAMTRGLDVIVEQDCDARIVELPPGEDPDSFVRAHGADAVEAVRERMRGALSFVDFIADRYAQSGEFDHPERKTAAIRHIMTLVARMDDRIRRDLYVHHIAEKYGVYESALYAELDAQLRNRRGEDQREQYRLKAEISHGGRLVVHAVGGGEREIKFLAYLLKAPAQILKEVIDKVNLGVFRNGRIARILHRVLEAYEHEGTVELDALDSELMPDPELHQVYSDAQWMLPDNSPGWSNIQTVTDPVWYTLLFQAYQSIVQSRMDEIVVKCAEAIKANPDDVGLVAKDSEMKIARQKNIAATDFSQLHIPEAD